jgi:hypothetical protein
MVGINIYGRARVNGEYGRKKPLPSAIFDHVALDLKRITDIDVDSATTETFATGMSQMFQLEVNGEGMERVWPCRNWVDRIMRRRKWQSADLARSLQAAKIKT